MGIPPKEEEGSKEVVKSFIQGSFLGVFVYLWPIIWFLSPHLTYPRTLPNMHVQFFSKYIPAQRPIGWPWHHTFWSDKLLLLTPKEPFCARAMYSSPQGWETYDLLIFYTNRVYPLSVSDCCYLKVSSGDKAWLFTLFLLLFLF